MTKAEFDRTWRADGLGDEERAPFFFLEMDRVADEVLNKEDFVHMFHVFDENGMRHFLSLFLFFFTLY